MNNRVLYILLPDYAAHEAVYLSQAIASDAFALKENPKYINQIVAPTLEPVKSIGGFRVLPDYSFETMPDDYAALALIGGFGWAAPVAEKVAPLVKSAIENGKIVGAICNAVSLFGTTWLS
ncbi:DJ-1/PfpI family protein [uncultured Desulfovibrio sp.]|uniref:DJ-1/PfpI family protein n=1 Tax=uncultured Desulfovibrio sp. TaxID=167968 RepID=UPI002608C416|nr:DJ-1/PfpI family protein [uncultured Desulfovibrio sp.]